MGAIKADFNEMKKQKQTLLVLMFSLFSTGGLLTFRNLIGEPGFFTAT